MPGQNWRRGRPVPLDPSMQGRPATTPPLLASTLFVRCHIPVHMSPPLTCSHPGTSRQAGQGRPSSRACEAGATPPLQIALPPKTSPPRSRSSRALPARHGSSPRCTNSPRSDLPLLRGVGSHGTHSPAEPTIALALRALALSSRRLVVVHDPLMRFACAEAYSIPNAEMYEFQCVTASYMLSLFTDDLKIIDDKLSREVRNVILTQFPDRCPEELFVFLDKYWRDLSSEAGVVMNTCKEIDGEFIELMPHVPRYRNKKLFAIGPMSPVSASGGDHDRRIRRLRFFWEHSINLRRTDRAASPRPLAQPSAFHLGLKRRRQRRYLR
ncbi:uncharacterized protein A4U43_C05F27180 [Asparagus officinalis]|uniref:Glycosyltransferase N-terminal domain-containing protein n=1 Tax=Asparagus officinalis TaxID=4686 RepID=A0A5P1F080_ASPOF|nr:uncharacterized protein A4U43_C05F27180 [Asparagus officinalis]